MPEKKKGALFGAEDRVALVYGGGRREQAAERTDLYPVVIHRGNFEAHADSLQDLEVIFATWGMPALSAEQAARLPALRAVFYAAGAVQHFAHPLLEQGVLVVSGWRANAVPVAEFALAQILLSGKGYWQNARTYRSPETRAMAMKTQGNFNETVALLGAGAVGRTLIGFLKSFALKVIVFDPYLSEAEATSLGAEKVTLEEAFRRGFVVSNHLADKPQTEKMLTEAHFTLMREGAVFINTGRGATVDEEGMIRALKARPSLTALLDVTHPEPPAADSPLYSMPNVHLSSHIAGAGGNEVLRLADLCLSEFDAWEAGRPLKEAVTLAMLEWMA